MALLSLNLYIKFRSYPSLLENMAVRLTHEMAQAWHLEISDRTIGKALKKIGFPRKKLTGIEKEMKKKDKNLSKKSIERNQRSE
ncbi:hypothetical protein C7Y66_09510 [Chroococcidiopsis sp. CCALA 051]|nr:hypothetical protein C7Y66_09510 [Chroococcidiopsis sp. CCALA 051]